MTFKKIAGRLHLWLGLSSGLVVLVVALTGAILVFEKETDEWANHSFYFTEVPQQAQRLPVDSLLSNARHYDPSIKITGIELDTDAADRNVLARGKKGGYTWHLALDPYTGRVAGAINYDHRFFTIVLKLHRYLLAGDVGKTITGIASLLFLVLVLTGLVLWLPKRTRNLKQRLKVKWEAHRKRLNWDLHAIGGFYSHLVIFVLAFTGLTWSYKWFNNGIFLAFDGKPMQKREAPANRQVLASGTGYFEKLYQETNRRLPYRGVVNISLPANDSISITVTKDNNEASVPNVVDFLFFEQGSGVLLKERLYRNESRGMKVRRLIYPIHTGSIYGWPTKLIAFICCLVAVSLPITGFRIWMWKKKKKHRTTTLRYNRNTSTTPNMVRESGPDGNSLRRVP